jgi:hypothetical protein
MPGGLPRSSGEESIMEATNESDCKGVLKGVYNQEWVQD